MRGWLVDGVRLGRHSSVADLLEATSIDPDRRLLMWPDGRWSVGDLASQARARASELLRRGVGEGDRIAIVSGNSAERMAWQFGVWWIGAVEVSVNSELRGPMLHSVLADSDPALVVVEREFVDILPALEAVVLVAEETECRCVDEPFARLLDERALGFPAGGVATIMYTSGTTGPSKGVMLPRAYFSNHGAVVARAIELEPDDVGYFVFPFFHVDAHIVISAMLQSGSTLAFNRRFSASRFWSQIIDFKATWVFVIGAVLAVVMATDDGKPPQPTRVRRMFGGPMPDEAYAHFEDGLGMSMISLYGQTECDGPLIGLGRQYRRGAVGHPCAGFDVEIQDTAGRSVLSGVSGEIVYRPQYADMMTVGYWRRDDATVEGTRGLWFHSGDRGRMDDDGTVTFEGRMTDSLRRRGENISALELESVLNSAPHVDESAAVAVVDEMGGEDEIKVFVVPSSGQFDLDEFFSYCEENLPRYSMPLFVEITTKDSFVRAVGNGSILKRHLSRATGGPNIHQRPDRTRKESTR